MDRERRFKKMTKAQKRVAVAKDVIASLNTGLMVARQGVYFEAKDPVQGKPGDDLRDQLIKSPNRTVCA